MDPIEPAPDHLAPPDVRTLGPAARAELRKDNVAQAFRLRQENPTWTIADLARALARRPSTVYGYFHDPEADGARARKEAYRGQCSSCGADTSGGDGPGRAKDLCTACARARRWTPDSVAEVLRAWERDHGFRPTSHDLNPTVAKRRGGRALERYTQYGLAVSRVRAVFPGGYAEALAYAFADGAAPAKASSDVATRGDLHLVAPGAPDAARGDEPAPAQAA